MKTAILKSFTRIITMMFLVFAVTFVSSFFQSCAAVDYMKKNCKIETEIGSQSFICIICNFDNASEALKKRINEKLCKP